MGRTPLQYAVRENRSDVVAYFINNAGMDQKEYDEVILVDYRSSTQNIPSYVII